MRFAQEQKMGAWAAGLYAYDTTCEIRDLFRELIRMGSSPAQAREQILDQYADSISNHQVACLVYFALADTQWRLGCLDFPTKHQALILLGDGGDIVHWASASERDSKARARVLAKLHLKLLSPQPPFKPTSRTTTPPPKRQLDAAPGALFGLGLRSGNHAVLILAGLRKSGRLKEGVFRVLPWIGTELPPFSLVQGIASRCVPIMGHHEFSIFESDRRKNPIRQLTALSFNVSAPAVIDATRNVALNVDELPVTVEDALHLHKHANRPRQ